MRGVALSGSSVIGRLYKSLVPEPDRRSVGFPENSEVRSRLRDHLRGVAPPVEEETIERTEIGPIGGLQPDRQQHIAGETIERTEIGPIGTMAVTRPAGDPDRGQPPMGSSALTHAPGRWCFRIGFALNRRVRVEG